VTGGAVVSGTGRVVGAVVVATVVRGEIVVPFCRESSDRPTISAPAVPPMTTTSAVNPTSTHARGRPRSGPVGLTRSSASSAGSATIVSCWSPAKVPSSSELSSPAKIS